MCSVSVCACVCLSHSSYYFFYWVQLDMFWPVGINIGRLTRFIIQIHPSTKRACVCTIFFSSCSFVFLSLSLLIYMSMYVYMWVSLEANAHRDASTQHKKMRAYETEKSICSLVEGDDGHLFFSTRMGIEKEKIAKKRNVHGISIFTRVCVCVHARSFASHYNRMSKKNRRQ